MLCPKSNTCLIIEVYRMYKDQISVLSLRSTLCPKIKYPSYHLLYDIQWGYSISRCNAYNRIMFYTWLKVYIWMIVHAYQEIDIHRKFAKGFKIVFEFIPTCDCYLCWHVFFSSKRLYLAKSKYNCYLLLPMYRRNPIFLFLVEVESFFGHVLFL